MTKFMFDSIIWMLAISLTTCSNQANDKSGENEMSSSSSLKPAQYADLPNNDSLIIGKVELAKIYSQAIEEYIRAVSEKEKTNFDTLFLGKQLDFPDIDLPTTIGRTKIRLLAQEAIGNKKSIYSQSSPYINLIGFVESDRAEFIFVTFYPEFQHRYDCYMDFRYDSEKKEFDLDKLRIEVLIRSKEGKPDHYAVYEDGKYTGDKPIQGNKE